MTSSEGQQDGREIRRLRKDLGITRSELAARVHLQPEALTSIENGRKPAGLETLTKIAEVLDVRLIRIVRPGTALHTALTRGGSEDEGAA